MPDDETLDPQIEDNGVADDDVDDEAAEPSLEDKLKEVVEVDVEEVGTLRKKLTITVPRDMIGEQLDDQYDELRRDATVPGFRKGRAPRRLLEKRFGQEVSGTLVQQMVGNGYLAAIDKVDLKVIGDPLIFAKEKDAENESLMDVEKAIPLIELPEEGPLTFACEVEIRPEFDLPELKGIPVNKPALTVSDEDVDAGVERIRAMRGYYETLADGEVEPDDVVIADITMTSEGTELKKQDAVRMAARPQVIDGVSLENLGDVLKGAKAGDVKTLSGTIGDDYIKTEFRGKQADFEIKVREVQRLNLPELDDELVKGFGFENLQELRGFVKNDLESRLDEQVRRAMSEQVLEYLLSNTELELPERLSERQAGRVIVRRMLDLYRQGVPPAEAEKHLDELKTSAQADTVRDLKLFFILEKLAEEFDVEVTEGEINGMIAGIAQRQGRRFDRVRDELSKEGGLTNMYLQLRDEKIVEQLMIDANVTEEEASDKAKGEGDA